MNLIKWLLRYFSPSKALLRDYALSHLGLPYRWGGDDPLQGYDCSGLVVELLKSTGILPHKFDTTAQGLYNKYEADRVKVPQFGALAFYGSKGKITHVSFCLSKTECIEAGGGGSRTKTPEDAAKHNAYIRIRPIKYRNDLVGYALPPYSWQGTWREVKSLGTQAK